jgi:hypothetical protein
MVTDAKGNAVYNGKPLKTKSVIITTDRFVKEGAKIS